jgi:hypothetical protein
MPLLDGSAAGPQISRKRGRTAVPDRPQHPETARKRERAKTARKMSEIVKNEQAYASWVQTPGRRPEPTPRDVAGMYNILGKDIKAHHAEGFMEKHPEWHLTGMPRIAASRSFSRDSSEWEMPADQQPSRGFASPAPPPYHSGYRQAASPDMSSTSPDTYTQQYTPSHNVWAASVSSTSGTTPYDHNSGRPTEYVTGSYAYPNQSSTMPAAGNTRPTSMIDSRVLPPLPGLAPATTYTSAYVSSPAVTHTWPPASNTPTTSIFNNRTLPPPQGMSSYPSYPSYPSYSGGPTAQSWNPQAARSTTSNYLPPGRESPPQSYQPPARNYRPSTPPPSQ